MNHPYKIIVSNKIVYREFELPREVDEVKLGTNVSCEFRLNPDSFFEGLEVELKKKDGIWSLACREGVYLSRGDLRKLVSAELSHGDVWWLRYTSSGDTALELRFLIDFEARIPDYRYAVSLTGRERLTVGDDPAMDLVLDSPFSKDNKLCIRRGERGYVLEEIQSAFGVCRNGRRVEGAELLEDSDFISVADVFFYYKKEKLYFDGRGIRAQGCRVTETESRSGFPYPMFVRNTRVQSRIEEEPIPILDPSSMPAKPELNLATTLMPALVMFALVVVLRGILSTTGGTFVLFSICSMGVGVITSVCSIVHGQRKYRREVQERRDTYLAYMERKRQEITCARQEELDCRREQYISAGDNLKRVMEFSPKLFDRIPEDEDFLDVYLGMGRMTARRKLDYKPKEQLEVGDELSRMPLELAEDFRYLEEAPVAIRLRDANAVGVVGNEEALRHSFSSMVLDLAARQYYTQLRLFVLLGEDAESYRWLRLLPHLAGRGGRNIVCDKESKNNLFESLYKELTERRDTKRCPCWNVILVMDEQGIKSHPISRFIEYAAQLQTVFVFFEKSEEFLPLHCSRIVNYSGKEQGMLYDSGDRLHGSSFRYQTVKEETIARAVERLAPVRCEEISLEGSLRKNISLFELLGIYTPEDLDLGERYRKSKIYESMAAPLGVNVKNEIISLNLHEKGHGPHGLVAGTTGSGKSEILQTFILTAATLFSPYEIGFVIIDFKGGGMVNQFRELPHLIGAITNIDGRAVARSLRSIKAELLKRQSLFAEAGVNHIDKYIRAYQEGKADTALPHLVIIVDEFAELKAEQPEFMKELISAARIGRSLGVHLILATQKPAGQVNEQIWSNSRFRLCLKVQSEEDSNEVLKSPLAAEIKEPGRAYLQVGNNEVFELFQSGYSGCPERTEEKGRREFALWEVDLAGRRRVVFRQEKRGQKGGRTQLEAMVDHIGSYCRSAGIRKLQEICLPELPRVLPFPEQTERSGCAVGVYDDPDRQYQGEAYLDVMNQNTLLIGASQFGKTNLLEVIVRSLAEQYSPREVNLYILDFGSMVLKNLEGLEHVGGVVCPDQDERLKNLFKFLQEQLALRRSRMLSAGVSSFSSYRETGKCDLPQIVVLIDNFTVLKELYLQDNDELLTLCREGLSAGISFCVANSQTNGIGYRYLSNFAVRIGLFCNEPGEYNTLFGVCRLRPEDIPGRGILELDKTLYECQTYLAFPGEREVERMEEMKRWIARTNERYPGCYAQPIPEIPKILTEQDMLRRQSGDGIGAGLDYATVQPVFLEVGRRNLLALSGGEDGVRCGFIRYFVHSARALDLEPELTVFDDFGRRLAGLETGDGRYHIDPEGIGEAVLELEACLQERYRRMAAQEPYEESMKLLIINSAEAAEALSENREAMAALKNITGKYRMLKGFVLFGNVPNAPIPYGAPESYKLVKEEKQILFFGDLESCRLVDIPLAVIRSHRKKIGAQDAYLLVENDCYRLKTPMAAQE